MKLKYSQNKCFFVFVWESCHQNNTRDSVMSETETQFEYGIQEYAKSSALPKSKDNRKNIFL